MRACVRVCACVVEGESEEESVLAAEYHRYFYQTIDNITLYFNGSSPSFLPGFGSRYTSPILEDICVISSFVIYRHKFLAEVEFGVLLYNRAILFCFLLMLDDFLSRNDDDSLPSV